MKTFERIVKDYKKMWPKRTVISYDEPYVIYIFKNNSLDEFFTKKENSFEFKTFLGVHN